ncbi:hypothetical protein [Sulfitobacter sp. M23508]|uniref:hypothetical protein n=1 Tax=Sulfitobacter sp. M23508 TaxID=3368577 RepID=UPI0037452565
MTVNISSEAAERLAREFDARVKQFDRIVAETPESVRALRADRGEETREQHVKTAATLRAQAERIKELEAERDAFRAVLEGAEYREIDEIAKQDPDMCRMLGAAVASLTKSEIAKTRNDALREIEVAADKLGYHCIGCGHLCGNPEKDLAMIRKAGGRSCCPEREMEPLSKPILALIEGDTND